MTLQQLTNAAGCTATINHRAIFTVVYHLYSFERNEYVRLKVALNQNQLSLPTITDVFSLGQLV